MGKLRKAVKLAAINLFVFLMMVWSLNLLTSIGLDIDKLFLERWFPTVNKKHKRDSLKDRDLAHAIYLDFALLQTAYAPYVAWSRKPYDGKTTTVNQAGDRVHPATTEKPRGHVRLFGGSTLWGTGVDDANTIPAQFNALHRDLGVHNHGESGFVSRQELARLINLVNQKAPMDLVVFYDGCNEARTMCRADIPINGHKRQDRISSALEKRSAVVEDLVGSLRRLVNSALAKVEPVYRCEQEPAYARKVAQTLVNNWKIARRVAEQGGAEFHAVLQPVAQVGSPNVGYLGIDKNAKEKSGAEIVYPLVQELMRRENADWMHDFTDVFDGDDLIYIDGCHVNALGNRLVAERLEQTVGGRLPAKDREASTRPEKAPAAD